VDAIRQNCQELLEERLKAHREDHLLEDQLKQRPTAEEETFPGLPVDASGIRGPGRARVCIATCEFAGPHRNGGIGTFCLSLATTLAEGGHQVVVLYLSPGGDGGSAEQWQSQLAALGIEFVPLPPPAIALDARADIATSYEAYRWLRKREFDVVRFPDWRGHGYYTALAKHQGLDFQNTAIWIGAHGSSEWTRSLNREFIGGPGDLETDFMEREAVALADVLTSPSRYMLRWMRWQRWQLPAKAYAQQNILSPHLRQSWEETSERRQPGAIRELVFFGRLEERKGVGLFCDALDQIARIGRDTFTVTFLGKAAMVDGRDGVEYIRERARRWSFEWQTLTDRDHAAALLYLRESGRLAVIPSLGDNAPHTVLECLLGRIPFLASRVGGIPELIASDGLEEVVFEPRATELAERLLRAISRGVALARPAIDPRLNQRQWIAWLDTLAPPATSLRGCAARTPPSSETPRVSVCVTHRNRPRQLAHAIASLAEQDWPNLEVVVADTSISGSTEDANEPADVAAELEHRGLRFRENGWKLIRLPGRSAAMARNAAAAAASGDYLLFMDAGDCAKPGAIGTFVATAIHSGADILTCFIDRFSGDDSPADGVFAGRVAFLGGAIGPGLFHNCFGSGNFLIRRTSFERLGGFAENGTEEFIEDRDASGENGEFLTRAVLEGLRLETVPRALAWRRVSGPSAPKPAAREYAERMRALQPYLEVLPRGLCDALSYAQGMQYRIERSDSDSGSGEGASAEGEPLGAVAAMIATSMACSDRIADRTSADDHPTGERKIRGRVDRKVHRSIAWQDYRSTRSNLPERRLKRLPGIIHLLVRGRYHRFAHGLGSALRDLRRPPRT
jgi:glycosyltransferase involved in cell wall biosynthesis/GT2 family glycosyltransferase